MLNNQTHKRPLDKTEKSYKGAFSYMDTREPHTELRFPFGSKLKYKLAFHYQYGIGASTLFVAPFRDDEAALMP